MNAFSADRRDLLKREIQERIGSSRFRTWFGDATEFRLHDGGVDIIVPSSFAGTWIAKNYMEHLVAATTIVLGHEQPPAIRIVQRACLGAAPEPAVQPDGSSRAANGGSTPHRNGRSAHSPQYRSDLDAFVIGPSNRLAHAAAISVVRSHGRALKLLVLHGGCGLGKTHLLQGIANGFRRLHPTLECRYVSGEAFTNEYIAAVRSSGPVDVFRAKYRRVDVLIVDDIHFLANKRATQEEFLHTYNAIDAVGKAVVVSSDRHPRSIATLSEPLMNRLVSGTVVQIDPPDSATRREILRRRAATLGLSLSEEVIDLVAERITRNVRELEGALYTLNALSSLNHEKITPDLVRRALDQLVVRSRKAPDLPDIVQCVVDGIGVTSEQIDSRTRDRTVVLARSVAMLLARRHTSMSFPEIGRAMGGKNHSTVLMATQRLERLLSENATAEWHNAEGAHNMPLRTLIESMESRLVASGGLAAVR